MRCSFARLISSFSLSGSGTAAVIGSASSGEVPQARSARSRTPEERSRCRSLPPRRTAASASNRQPAPHLALRRHRAVLKIGEGLLVGGNHAGAGATLDGHVVDRHPAFHRQVANGRACELDDMTGATGGADLADDGKDDVLCRHPGGEFAINGDAHVLGRLLNQRLRRQHMLDLGGADAESKRPEGAMGGGVRIAADNGHAGLRKALLGPITWTMPWRTSFMAKKGTPNSAAWLQAPRPGCGSHPRSRPNGLLSEHCGRQRRGCGSGRGPTSTLRRLQRPVARHLMDKMPVDIDQAGAVILAMHDMRIPDFVKQGLWRRHVFLRRAAPRSKSWPVHAVRRKTPRGLWFFRQCGRPCRSGHADNTASRAAPGHVARRSHRRPAGRTAGRRARRPRHRTACER